MDNDFEDFFEDFDLDSLRIDQPKPKGITKGEWGRRHREMESGMTSRMKDPFTIKIVCSHKGREADGRPVTLADAIVDRAPGGRITINEVPVSGNMGNRSNRKSWYNPVAYDRGVPALTPAELEEQGLDEEPMYEHDIEAQKRKHVTGKSRIRRNASTSYESDQMICPRCPLHERRKQATMDHLFRALAADGVKQLDVSHLDVLLALLPPEPKPTFDWGNVLP